MLFLLPPPLAILKYSTIRPWHRLKNPGLGPLLASRKDSEVKTSSSWRSRSDGSWPNFLMIFQWFWCCLSDSWCFLLSVFLFLRTNFDDFWMFAHDFFWLCMFFCLFWTSFWPIVDELWLMCSMILWLFFAPAFSLRFHFCGFVGTAPAPALFVEQNITKSYLWSRKKGGEV